MMSDSAEDTIFAPATSVGSGAVTIIRVSGPAALDIVSEVVSFKNADLKGGSVKFGVISELDEVLVSIFRAPHSYTGEDSAEICCHASRFIATGIMDRLRSAGARMAEPGEFTRRAYLNGKMDLSQAEAVADLIAADSQAAHRAALNQIKGTYSLELKGLRDQLVELTTLLELELDFSEEEVEFADRTHLNDLLGKCIKHCDSLAESFRDGNAIKNGVPTAIVGAPNSGKSTLLNALLGEDRAIVSDVPGTTRDTVEEVMTIDGVQYRFIDTAGLRESTDKVEKIGIERSLEAARKARIIIAVDACGQGAVLDSGAETCASAREMRPDNWMKQIRAGLENWQSLILVHNKCDLSPADNCLGALDAVGNCDGETGICASVGMGAELRISALKGWGIAELKDEISRCFAAGHDADATIVTNARHRDALVNASENLSAARESLENGLPGDLVSEDLRAAITSLNSIFGEEIGTEEVLGEIFGRFCIGK